MASKIKIALRGFVTMIDNWLKTLLDDSFSTKRAQDIWQTHHLCEQVHSKTTTYNKSPPI